MNPTAPPLLSAAPTRRADRYAALAIVILSLLGFVAMRPYAATPMPHLIAFNLSNDTGLTLIYVITAMLLLGQFVQLRTPSLLVLASGYVFAGVILITHILAMAPIVQAAWPHSANARAAGGLSVLWHSFFPIFVMLYAVQAQSRHDRPIDHARVLPAIGLGISAAFGLTALCVLIAIAAPPQRLGFGQDSNQFTLVGAAGSWVICLAALLMLYSRTRARRVLDLWLCVALFAWLLDILTGEILSQGLYNFDWYAGRIYGILAAAVVLSALLLETGALYARLTRALADMKTQSTALSESEAALRQAQKMEAIGQLTGGVAHDFNNLLTVIIGSLDMLRTETERNPRAVRLTDYAMQAAVRGEQLTKQLLAFSRRQMLNPEVRNPNRLIRDFDALMRRAIGAAIRIVLELEEGVGSVLVDPAQFEAAILNLAVNARDAMDGAGTITIATTVFRQPRWRQSTPNCRPATMCWSRCPIPGPAWTRETIARVFEPFFTTKPTGKGSGLGLSQVYGFACSSRGWAKIESELGKGTTVRLYLPAVEDEPTPAAPIEATDSTPQAIPGEIVLAVEDDFGVRDIAIETLTELGYGALTARNAPEALALIRGGARIDLLFSDIVMPEGMNGVELSAEARRIRPGLKVLLTSGYTGTALAGQTKLPDHVAIIPKPYRLEDLAWKLRQVLDG